MLRTLTPTTEPGQVEVLLFCLCSNAETESNGFLVLRLRRPLCWGAGLLPTAPGTFCAKASTIKTDIVC